MEKKEQGHPLERPCSLAGLDGVEPSRRESKSRVLPLDYSPICDCLRILPHFWWIVKCLNENLTGLLDGVVLYCQWLSKVIGIMVMNDE